MGVYVEARSVKGTDGASLEHPEDFVQIAMLPEPGDPVLVAHGLFGNSHSTVNLRTNLAENTGLDVYAIRPDTSSSLLDPRALTLSSLAASFDVDFWVGHNERVRNAIDTLAQRYQRPVTIVGHSHGGLVATEVADPALVRRIVLVESPVGAVREMPDGIDIENMWSWGDLLVTPLNKLIPVIGPMLNPKNRLFGDPTVFGVFSGVDHLAPLRKRSRIHNAIAEKVLGTHTPLPTQATVFSAV